MMLRLTCLAILPCLGCHPLKGADPAPPSLAQRADGQPPAAETHAPLKPAPRAAAVAQPTSTEKPSPQATSPQAEEFWQKGQEAMKAGEHDKAIDFYRRSLAAGAALPRNHLSLAAAYVAKGDEAAACFHLGVFLKDNPEHRNARLYFAELLMRLKRFSDSRRQFERSIADAQDERTPDRQCLLHCHGRLMEMADLLEDDYQEHLHRGISYYLLAQERAERDDPAGVLPVESLLFRAAAQLTTAKALRPQEARPCWYLHCIWRQLGQAQPAQRWLRSAIERAPFTHLSPCEQRDLHLALARF